MSAVPWLDGVSARDLAVAVFRRPGGHENLMRGRGALPDDVIDVMRLAQDAARHHGDASHNDELHRAALFFVEHVLLAPECDHYRVLGLARGAEPEAVKEHYRVVMAIFHPDRSPWLSGDREGLAARINVAYRTLRDPGRRASYDLDHGRSKAIRMSGGATPAPKPRGAADRHADEPLFSRLPLVVQRFFPQFVLGGVAFAGALVVLGTYLARAPAEAIGMGAVSAAADLRSVPVGSKEALHAVPTAPVRQRQDVAASAGAESAMASPAQPTSLRAPMTVAAAAAAPPAPPVPSTPAENLAAPEPAATRSAVRTGDRVDRGDRPAAQRSLPAGQDSARNALEPERSGARIAAPSLAQSRGQNAPQSAAERQREHREEAEGAARQVSLVATAVAAQPAEPEPVAPNPIHSTRSEQPEASRVTVPSPVAAVTAREPPAAGPPSPSPHIERLEAIAVVNRFADAYGRASASDLLELFSADARSNSGKRPAIRSDYEALFRATRARNIGFHDLRWTFEGERATAEGGFIVRVMPNDQSSEALYVGTLRFELVKVEGRVLIKGLFHENSN